jgi:uncharacterized lipoprotein YmbA
MRILFFSLVALATFGLTGCSLIGENKFKQVNYYDLGTPVNRSLPNVTVQFTNFRALEAAKYKMVYHTDQSRVLIDDYNKWIQTPAFMLNRNLQFAFCQPPGSLPAPTDHIYLISGTLFTFKIDLEKSQTVLGVSYVIQQRGKEAMPPLVDKSVRYVSKFEKHDGLYFARSMTRTVEQLADDIQKDIKNLESKK